MESMPTSIKYDKVQNKNLSRNTIESKPEWKWHLDVCSSIKISDISLESICKKPKQWDSGEKSWILGNEKVNFKCL